MWGKFLRRWRWWWWCRIWKMWKTAPLIPRFLYIHIYMKFLIFHIIVRVFVSKKSISSCDEIFFMNTRISPYEFSRKLHFHPPKKRGKNNKKVSFNVIYTKTCPMYSLMWRIATTTTLRPPSTWKHFVNALCTVDLDSSHLNLSPWTYKVKWSRERRETPTTAILGCENSISHSIRNCFSTASQTQNAQHNYRFTAWHIAITEKIYPSN